MSPPLGNDLLGGEIPISVAFRKKADMALEDQRSKNLNGRLFHKKLMHVSS